MGNAPRALAALRGEGMELVCLMNSTTADHKNAFFQVEKIQLL
jgi:hypothetical protein